MISCSSSIVFVFNPHHIHGQSVDRNEHHHEYLQVLLSAFDFLPVLKVHQFMFLLPLKQATGSFLQVEDMFRYM